jgi:hypothetical protein
MFGFVWGGMRMKNHSAVGLGIVLLLGVSGALPAQNQTTMPAQLTADEVGAQLDARNRVQSQEVQAFEGQRIYRLHYHGLGGTRDATLTVRMSFEAPFRKRFTVVEQEGSKIMIDRVLKKLMQSEQEAIDEDNRRSSALTVENYEFAIVDYETRPGGAYYVLQVTPRHMNKFLYKGKIWVDAKEFAVVHLEVEPARNPSFWIKKTKIEHDYVKIGDFWFPAKNRTESQIRFGGRADLTIDYTDYKVTSVTARNERDTSALGRPSGCNSSSSSVNAGPCREAPLLDQK